MKKSKYDICIVTWEDSVSHEDWDGLEEHDGLHTIVSCGFIIRNSSKYITMALNMDQCPEDESLFSQTISIPRVNIVSMKKLGVLDGRER